MHRTYSDRGSRTVEPVHQEHRHPSAAMHPTVDATRYGLAVDRPALVPRYQQGSIWGRRRAGVFAGCSLWDDPVRVSMRVNHIIGESLTALAAVRLHWQRRQRHIPLPTNPKKRSERDPLEMGCDVLLRFFAHWMRSGGMRVT